MKGDIPKILIVEDRPILYQLLFLQLHSYKYHINIASTRDELLAKLQSFNPDLVILDETLGPETGTHICKEIKSRNPADLVILMSTALDISKVNNDCHADGIFEKPVDLQPFIQKIRALLE